MKRWKSLAVRLTASYLFLAVMLVGIMGAIFSAVILDYARQVQVARLNQARDDAANLLAEYQVQEIPGIIAKRFPDIAVEFAEPLFVGVRTLPPQPLEMFPAPRVVMSFRKPEEGELILPVVAQGRPVGQFIFRVSRPFYSVLASLYWQLAGTVVVILALAGLVGWYFSRRLSRPIGRLTEATAAVAGGDFLQAVEPTGTEELDQLAVQFNLMVTRLNESFRTLAAERDLARRFAADAAHELKTPLTALKAYRDLTEAQPARQAQLLPAMGRQIERIEAIITGLNQLARLSEGTGITLERGDICDVLRAGEPTCRTMAAEHGHTLAVEGLHQPAFARLDPRLLEIAVTNLVSNACKFTAPGGRVGISVTASAATGEAVVTVSDTGRGIPPDELPHVFERFHRGIDTQSIPGSGLGLSIVQEAVTRMGGRVAVESEVGVGSRFAIILPLA